ncbi:MAG: diaminopimelate decarboxylase [Gammaproteobacteria bacterium]|nr:diaminopimelate decarboxylase [Gammaproteobacteria bacterium]
MDHFLYRDGRLHAEDVAVSDIVREYGSPLYIYSRATLERHWHAFDDALKAHEHLVCYAVKANSNLAVLNVLAKLGSGFDIVSVGELERVLAAGGDPARVVFSGVGKRVDEIERALAVGIHCFNVESEAELQRINEVAGRMGKTAPVSLRVNPDVDAQTHPYISTGLKENKFGIAFEDAPRLYTEAAAMEHIRIKGGDCHIGSQLTSLAPFVDALKRVLALIEQLAEAGIELEHLDIGGGLGIRYKDETPPEPADYSQALAEVLGNRKLKLIVEPGRAIAGNAGIFITRVEHLKLSEHKNFAIIDGAMNDLIRPTLYQAWQAIVPVQEKNSAESRVYDVVGPVCETGDYLGKDRELAIEEGDLLAVRSSGAYGFTMSSNYNTRPRAAEVMVDGHALHLVRKREELAELFQDEYLLPE